MPNVFLGAPTTRDLPIPYVKSLWTTEIKGKMSWDVVYGQAIDIGRNSIIKKFLKYTEYDYLLMHDSDASWSPGAVQRMVDRDLPCVTGVIFRRGFPTLPTIGKHVSISPEGAHMYSFTDTVNKIYEIAAREKWDRDVSNNQLLEKHDGDIQEVDGAGAHFMLIRRDVIEAIGTDWWYQCSRTNSGEDFDFCRKVQAAGFKLYCDFSIFTGHHLGGTLELGVREFLMFADKAKLDTVWTM